MKNKSKLSSLKMRNRRSTIAINLLVMISAATIALACGWGFFQENSVRFGGHSTERAFYRLPPLPDVVDAKTGQWKSRYDNSVYNESETNTDSENKGLPELKPKDIWQRAEAAEREGKLTKTKELLRAFLKIASDEEQLWINSANDRLDAMTALTQGASEREVLQYLERRREFEGPMDSITEAEQLAQPQTSSSLSLSPSTNIAPTISMLQIKSENLSEAQAEVPADYQAQMRVAALEKLRKAHPPRSLQDNYAYLQAATLYKLERFDGAKIAFHEVVTKYPKSEKREAAMYMISIIAVKISAHQATKDCGLGIGDEADRANRRAKCQDENWRTALLAMTQLLNEYPHGKFAYATYENRAYHYRLGGELGLGLADYYRMLGHPSDVRVRLKGKEALRLMGEDFVGADSVLNQIEEELANDPQAALAYAYHRIYNRAVDYSYAAPSRWISDRYDEQQKEEERVRESLSKGHGELRRIISFATKLMQRYPKSGVSGGFVLRVAQAQLELQNFQEALQLSNKALSLSVTGDLRADALWIKGSAEHQRKDFKAAKASFTRLIAEFPQSHLTEGARRLLAVNAEDSGNLEEALEHYIALKYEDDIAYFIDVLLTPEQLAGFIEHHPKLEKRDIYSYSLGLKYLRQSQWDKARNQFSSIQTVKCNGGHNWYGSAEPQNPKWDNHSLESGGGVCSDWLLSDLKTTDDLARLERQIEAAQGDEAKAEAMYQFASYQYQNSQLLFYNPMLWGGMRHYKLVLLDENNYYRLPNEAKILYDYMQSHENLSRAIPTYLELARLYPNTRAARDGLYTAVVAHRRLASNYNNYWRKLYANGLQAGEHLVTFRDVRSLYPKYQMPRGEAGWEPITRTVNGGPGWAAPPKPLPKLTWAQKFKHYLRRFTNAFQTSVQPKVDDAVTSYTTYLWRCLYAVLIALGLVFSWYAAVLGLHFWKLRKPVLVQELSIISPDDSPPPMLPDSASRVEKIINEK